MEDEVLDWIKSYRKMLKWEWSDDPHMFALWNRLLLEANYKPEKWHGRTIESGQLVTSLSGLSERSGISVQSLRTCLQRLVDSKQISKESTNKYTIITICNYERYQAKNTPNQQTDNNPPSNEPQENDGVLEVLTGEDNIPQSQPKVGYEIYGSFKNVQLKPSEYRTLEMNYSKAALDEAIENLSCKLADGTAQSTNNYATLTRWLSYVRKYGTEARQESGYKGDRSIGSEFTYKS